MNERDEALRECLLGGAGREGLELEERAELEELEALLARARAEASATPEWSSIREGALVGRVLARTTREDLSWRGDLRLVTSFVRDRIAASPVLKLVAASLLVHLIALPVLGWYVLREPENRATLYIGPPLQTEESAFLEEQELPVVREPSAEDRLAERVENARRRARYVLAQGTSSVAAAAGTAPLEIRLLALRTGVQETGRDEEGGETDGAEWRSWVDDAERFERADRLQRVLWIDVLLDRNVQTGRRAALLNRALNGLAAEVRAGSGAGVPALAALERRTLDRARSYGLWEAETGFDPLAVAPPFDPVWCASLDALLRGRGIEDHPVLTAIRSRCAP